MIFSFIFVLGCCCKQDRATEEIQQQEQQQQINMSSSDMMRVGFSYPIVMVNGQRAETKESMYLETIELLFPQKSTNNLVVTVVDADEIEHTLYGDITIFEYTEHSKSEKDLVLVAPDDPEYIYDSILRNGYGEFIVREHLVDPDKGMIPGEELLKITLGTKKKKDNKIAFYFPQDSLNVENRVEGPLSLLVDPNTQHNLSFAMDQDRYYGVLDVYQSNYYTKIAPVIIQLGEKEKRCLRSHKGQVKLAIYVPSKEERMYNMYPFSTMIDPAEEAKERGTVVAFLTIKRS
jgi:hypothetical protein